MDCALRMVEGRIDQRLSELPLVKHLGGALVIGVDADLQGWGGLVRNVRVEIVISFELNRE